MECALYPSIYGNEEETSLQFRELKRAPTADEVVAIHQAYAAAVAPQIVSVDRHNTTGGGMYADREHLELTTSECRTIESAVARIQGNEDIVATAAQAYLGSWQRHDTVKAHAKNKHALRTIDIQRRVIDTAGNSYDAGNTFGCHDNFGYIPPGWWEVTRGEQAFALPKFRETLRPMLLGHLAARSFVTGAGRVVGGRFYFAQKIRGVLWEDKYQHVNSLYRCVIDEGNLRLEVRCNDVNISPWALRMRLGSTAITAAIAQTPLADRFAWFTDEILAAPADAPIDAPHQYNHSGLTEKGTLAPPKQELAQLRKAMQFERQLADVFLSDDMLAYGQRPEELIQIARDLRQYCNDFEAVLEGAASIDILQDRADWAAKFGQIIQQYNRDLQRGKQNRAWGDATMRRCDLLYDSIEVQRQIDPRGKQHFTVRKTGFGYSLRDRLGQFLRPISAEAVARGKVKPGRNTRAEIREFLIRTYDVVRVDWRGVTLANKDPEASPNRKEIHIALPNALQATLTSRQWAQLRQARPRDAVQTASVR